MVWCTCAWADKYFNRLKPWREQFGHLQADFYVFLDGKQYPKELEQELGVKFVTHDTTLGRKTMRNFPGWKRSFGTAMLYSMDYDFCVHIESDVLIQDTLDFVEYCYTPGIFAAHDRKYDRIETAVMFLNDAAFRRQAASTWSDAENWHTDKVFEDELVSFSLALLDAPAIKYPFDSYRVEGEKMTPEQREQYAFLAQVGGNQ